MNGPHADVIESSRPMEESQIGRMVCQVATGFISKRLPVCGISMAGTGDGRLLVRSTVRRTRWVPALLIAQIARC